MQKVEDFVFKRTKLSSYAHITMQQRVDRSSMLRLLRVCQLNSIAVSRQTSKRTVPKALKFARFRVRTPIKRESIKAERAVTIILQSPVPPPSQLLINTLWLGI